jgi:hypothetical protein
MAGFWGVRISKEESERLEKWWHEHVATAKAKGNWPLPWPKMTEERLEKRRRRLEKKYGRRYTRVNGTAPERD